MKTVTRWFKRVIAALWRGPREHDKPHGQVALVGLLLPVSGHACMLWVHDTVRNTLFAAGKDPGDMDLINASVNEVLAGVAGNRKVIEMDEATSALVVQSAIRWAAKQLFVETGAPKA